jgi:hypothetical protein
MLAGCGSSVNPNDPWMATTGEMLGISVEVGAARQGEMCAQRRRLEGQRHLDAQQRRLHRGGRRHRLCRPPGKRRAYTGKCHGHGHYPRIL